MANPLPNEKELYEQIRSEKIAVDWGIWDMIYNRLGDDLTCINLICQYYSGDNLPIPVEEAKKILIFTRHIKDIITKVAVVANKESLFPEFGSSFPLNPIIREMLTHYIGNDTYMVNLIVGDAIDPIAPHAVTVESTQKIIQHTRSMKAFMNRLLEATLQKA